MDRDQLPWAWEASAQDVVSHISTIRTDIEQLINTIDQCTWTPSPDGLSVRNNGTEYSDFASTADILTHLFGGRLDHEHVQDEGGIDQDTAVGCYNSVALHCLRDDPTHRDQTIYLRLIDEAKSRWENLSTSFYPPHRVIKAFEPGEETRADEERRAMLFDWLRTADNANLAINEAMRVSRDFDMAQQASRNSAQTLS